MGDNFESSLINLGELSKPATILVEKTSDAVGGIFKPYQIIRVAKAEAQADRVRAENQIEISDLHRRAFHRFLNEEAIKQNNIEQITEKALPLLNEDSHPKEIDNDWIVSFFDRCRLISNEEMQTLWSRVLAGEANSPGRFSKRTLSFLTGLDKQEAEAFTLLCRFLWDIGVAVPLIYFGAPNYAFNEIYQTNGINDQVLKDLESLGLIQLTDGAFVQPFPKAPVSYYGRRILLNAANDNDNLLRLPIGRAQFTRVGAELAPISGAHSIEGFYELMRDHWKSATWMTVSELPD